MPHSGVSVLSISQINPHELSKWIKIVPYKDVEGRDD